MFILLDANVTAGYYLPRSLSSAKAGDRIQKVFDAVRTNQADHFFYIPNFCIAEVFGVFMKHAFGAWTTHVKTKGTIDKRVYESLVRQFSQDIHNGRFLCQYELSRYHILGINLVAPIDHYFQITRTRARKTPPAALNGKKLGGRRHVPAGTFDHLIVSMGIQLAPMPIG